MKKIRDAIKYILLGFMGIPCSYATVWCMLQTEWYFQVTAFWLLLFTFGVIISGLTLTVICITNE